MLLVSQGIGAQYALTLLSEHPHSFGYLLKDRVLAIDDFVLAAKLGITAAADDHRRVIAVLTFPRT